MKFLYEKKVILKIDNIFWYCIFFYVFVGEFGLSCLIRGNLGNWVKCRVLKIGFNRFGLFYFCWGKILGSIFFILDLVLGGG